VGSHVTLKIDQLIFTTRSLKPLLVLVQILCPHHLQIQIV
jgi:hypothetical protein